MEALLLAQSDAFALCGEPFTEGDEPELDRADAPAGYTDGNTRLVHHRCHRLDQQQKGFS